MSCVLFVAPVQKIILPSQTYAGLKGQPCVRGVQQQPPAVDVIGSEVKPRGSSVTQVEPHSFHLGNSLPTTGLKKNTHTCMEITGNVSD